MARYIMIIVLGGMFTFGISNISQNSTVNQGTQNAVDNFSFNRAHDIAGSMTDILLMRIANDLEYKVETEASEDLDSGEVTYTVTDTFFEGDSLLKVEVAAEYNDVTKTIITYVDRPTDGWIPPVVRGAWTANGVLDKTISDMYIDGRNYYKVNPTTWAIDPGTGVAGISTSIPFVNTENAEIGGTNNYIDYPMTFPEVTEVIEENYDWGGTFPTSPDQILGYPEGTLKAYAQSGVNGSQYFNYYDENDVNLPLSGVTYFELPPNEEAELRLGSLNSSGILIIHNPTGTTRISKTRMESTNYFEGIIIGDYMFHFHLDIRGAVILLSPDLELSQGCSNNKDHTVFYSGSAIEEVVGQVAETLGGQSMFGFGKKRLNVKYVYE